MAAEGYWANSNWASGYWASGYWGMGLTGVPPAVPVAVVPQTGVFKHKEPFLDRDILALIKKYLEYKTGG